jgi:hypothetical protein
MEEASSTPMSLWTPLTKRVPSHLPSTGLASYKKTQAVSKTVALLALRRSASGPDAPIRSLLMNEGRPLGTLMRFSSHGTPWGS